jgi:hypothetical protein
VVSIALGGQYFILQEELAMSWFRSRLVLYREVLADIPENRPSLSEGLLKVNESRTDLGGCRSGVQ